MSSVIANLLKTGGVEPDNLQTQPLKSNRPAPFVPSASFTRSSSSASSASSTASSFSSFSSSASSASPFSSSPVPSSVQPSRECLENMHRNPFEINPYIETPGFTDRLKDVVMFPSRQEQSEQEQNQRRQLLRKKMNAQARGKQTTYAAASDLECEQDPVEDGSVFSSSSFFALSKQIQQQVASLPLSMKQYLSSRGQGRGQGSFSFARVPVTSLAGDDNYNSQFSESEHERENEEERGSAGSLGKWMTTPFSSLTQTQTQTQESEKEGGLMASLRASVSCVDVRISSLSWTQKMAGFLVCAVLGLLCSFLSISNVALIVISPARFALPYTFGNILSLLGTSFLVGPSYQLNTMFSESRRIASSLYFSALFLTLYSAFVLQSTLPTLLCVLLQSLSFAWYCLSYIPGGRTIGRTMAHSVSGCLARRCFSFTNTAGSGI